MIDFYTWPTPNGRKPAIFFAETALAHRVIAIDITKGEQFHSTFLKINPNHKIPAIVDPAGPEGRPLVLFESGTILEYLAEKTGRFLPRGGAARWIVKQWLMFQMAGVGPMFGQHGHFHRYAPEKIPYAIERYRRETLRLYDVMNARLKDAEFLGGDYSIADMATYPWAVTYERRGMSLDDFPHVKRWIGAMAARPAVAQGMSILADREAPPGPITAEHRAAYFGDLQYQRRS
ncbi:MAG: glutathione S-transferase family protein [Alphaproteobacteria bacterium]|nr:glutathione S-transferase family protein [Alphaproteobacteria bacterium]